MIINKYVSCAALRRLVTVLYSMLYSRVNYRVDAPLIISEVPYVQLGATFERALGQPRAWPHLDPHSPHARMPLPGHASRGAVLLIRLYRLEVVRTAVAAHGCGSIDRACAASRDALPHLPHAQRRPSSTRRRSTVHVRAWVGHPPPWSPPRLTRCRPPMPSWQVWGGRHVGLTGRHVSVWGGRFSPSPAGE